MGNENEILVNLEQTAPGHSIFVVGYGLPYAAKTRLAWRHHHGSLEVYRADLRDLVPSKKFVDEFYRLAAAAPGVAVVEFDDDGVVVKIFTSTQEVSRVEMEREARSLLLQRRSSLRDLREEFAWVVRTTFKIPDRFLSKNFFGRNLGFRGAVSFLENTQFSKNEKTEEALSKCRKALAAALEAEKAFEELKEKVA